MIYLCSLEGIPQVLLPVTSLLLLTPLPLKQTPEINNLVPKDDSIPPAGGGAAMHIGGFGDAGPRHRNVSSLRSEVGPALPSHVPGKLKSAKALDRRPVHDVVPRVRCGRNRACSFSDRHEIETTARAVR